MSRDTRQNELQDIFIYHCFGDTDMSIYKNIDDPAPDFSVDFEWYDFINLCVNKNSFYNVKITPDITELPFFNFSKYVHSHDSDKVTLFGYSGLIIDINRRENNSIDKIKMLLNKMHFSYIIYTTPSHSLNNPSFRVVIPYSERASIEEHQFYHCYFSKLLGCDLHLEEKIFILPNPKLQNENYNCHIETGEILTPSSIGKWFM